jgi:predicted enzyme related to lactoylglutathione lyase
MSESGQANLPAYGTLVRVMDLPRLKAFYRDVLDLGQPVVDSNFWVEFALPGDGLLVLERCENIIPNTDGRNICWLLPVEDFGASKSRLDKHDLTPIHPPVKIPGVLAATYTDPEGNPFTLFSRCPKTSGDDDTSTI